MINSKLAERTDESAQKRMGSDAQLSNPLPRRSQIRGKLVARLIALVPAVAIAATACTQSRTPAETVGTVSSAAVAPSLGTTESFAVLAGSTVTNTGPTVVTGDLGVMPGLAVTGFPPGLVGGGTIQAGTAVALQAQSDTTAAYNDLAGQMCGVDLTGQDLGGLTLTAGSYCFSSSAQLTGTLTLDAQGDPNAVFVFQIGSTLTTASNSLILMVNGGSCNVFWQVGSSATVGTGTTFVGSILALSSITVTSGASIAGRALARNGAVTLDTNTVSPGSCAQVDAGEGGAGGSGGVAAGGPGTGGVAVGGYAAGGRATGGSTSGGSASGGSASGATAAGGVGTGGVATGGMGGEGGGDSSGGSAGSHTGGGAAGTSTCGGTCVDLQTDAMNCGSCGHVCDDQAACIKGMCCAG